MSFSAQQNPPATARVLLFSVLVLIGLVPPEVSGEALVAGALLIALFALSVGRGLDLSRGALLILIPLAAFPYMLSAVAPGAVVQPLTIAFIAVLAGLAASCLPRDLRSRPTLPIVVSCVATAVALYGVQQVLGGLDALVESLQGEMRIPDQEVILARARGGRAFALFPTPAALGGYLALILPITASEALARRGRARWLMLGLAGVQALGLLVAASATATAALLLALLFALVGRAASMRRVAFAAAAVLLILVAVVVQRGAEMTEFAGSNSPWRLRAGNFRIATEMIADRPWVGVGPGGFGEAYPSYRRPGDNESRHVHNLPLEIVAELGLPVGLLVSATFLFLFLGPLLRRTREAPPWWRGLEVGLAAFALHNLADFTAFLPSLLWSAAILRGWISRREAPPACESRSWMVVALLIGTTIATAAAVAGGLAANARAASRQAVVDGDPERAALLAQRAVRLAPWEVDGWLLYAQADLAWRGGTPGRLELARERLDRAVELSPIRPAARALRARVRAALEDAPGAYADAVVAARLYPMRHEYRELRDELARRLPRPPEPEPVP